MKKKGGIGLILIVILVIAGLGIGSYFVFFSMSESKAEGILKESYNKDQSKICDRFFVNDDKCDEFSPCYIEKAINAMNKPLLIQFAKDIQQGKSVAFDSYSLINGKEIGEQCLAQILNVPDNVNINLIN